MKHLQLELLFLFLFSLPGLKAQQNHFIYIQAENKQPFYVKLDKNLYSPTASGYMIMPKLKDGDYNLSIGFPKSEWAEQKIICTIDKNDIGYLLKNFGSKGWGLFNLQTLDVVMASDTAKAAIVEMVNNKDAFSNMLSKVVNDSTIRQTEIVKEVKKAPSKEVDIVPTVMSNEIETKGQAVELQKEKLKPSVVKDENTSTAVIKEIEKIEIEKDNASEIVDNTRNSITRSLLNNNADGTEMIFIDEVNGKKDTIRVFIPTEKKSVNVVVEDRPKEIEKSKLEPKAVAVKQDEKVKDSRFLEIELPGPNTKPEENKATLNKEISKDETLKPAEKPVKQITQMAPMINSDCKKFASDEDFLKLRKKMAGEDNDDDMIVLAKKLFKTRCFTVEQVKNLSVLFLKDAGKYAFFDMAYPFVSDSQNFSILQNQLSETYYINRFRVMIRH